MRFSINGFIVILDILFFNAVPNYLNRRWEERGRHYWYEHSAEGHKLILSDNSTVAEPVESNEKILYQTQTGSMDTEIISEFIQCALSLQHGSPSAALTSRTPVQPQRIFPHLINRAMRRHRWKYMNTRVRMVIKTVPPGIN